MGSDSGPLAKNGTILFDFPVAAQFLTDEKGLDKVENVVVGVLKEDFGELGRNLKEKCEFYYLYFARSKTSFSFNLKVFWSVPTITR